MRERREQRAFREIRAENFRNLEEEAGYIVNRANGNTVTSTQKTFKTY